MIDTTRNDVGAGTGAAAAGATGAASGSTGAASGSKAVGADTSAGIEDRFLKLLVAQMRNQDPLNPLDNTEVTSQLAQINTVRGIEELNQSMRSLVSSNSAVSPLSAVGLLGRQVLVDGDTFDWAGTPASAAADPLAPPSGLAAPAAAPVRFGFELPAAAGAVRVELTDAAGRVAMTREFIAPEAGVHSVEWNGSDDSGNAMPAGEFRLRVQAIDSAGAEMAVTSLVPVRVDGVSQAPTGARVDLSGGGTVPVSAIRAVL